MRVGAWSWVLVGRYWSWDFPLDLDFRLARYPVFWLVAAEIEVCFSFPWDNCTLFYLLLAVAGAGGLFGNGSGIVLLFLLAEHAMYCLCCGNCCGFPLARCCCGFWGLCGLGCLSSRKETAASVGKLLGVAGCRARRAKADRLLGKALTFSINCFFRNEKPHYIRHLASQHPV